ncbi:Calx-beta domain-containing protein, partial [Crocosphaera sp. XPORK-15E]|uniref:Calx-beta domain-containing protein n=1 Tax=Crocosphaera sp. XPORK-15E TaxID=3110247 RepID=UPI002B1EB9A3
LFFTATNSANGQELWKLDNSGNPVLLKDIRTGANGSSPSNLFNLNGTLYFTANDGTNGTELWKSDGTTVGTVQLEIYPGTNGSSVSNFINIGGVLYFTANNATNGTELWRINATTGNPEVIEIQPGSNGSNPTNLTNVNGTLYFTATNLTNGTELWKIDPTTGNPVVIDVNTGSSGSSPSNLINVNGTLYFTANNGINGVELWKIDPTTGTPSVIDIYYSSNSSSPSNLINGNGTLYFTAINANGRELWKIDSTTGNPVFLKDIYVGSSSSSPGNLIYSNGKLYFTADNFTQGVELWQTDGTTTGTVLTQDINQTTYGSNPRNFIKVGGTLYFTADNDIDGTELWKSDSSTGDVTVIDINSGSGSSSPSNLTNVNGTLYFTANNGINGTEIWKIDPTTGNPVLIDIRTGSNSSSPSNLTNVNGTLYFTAYTPTYGQEIWKIDSTTGTPSVIDIYPGGNASSPSNLTNANGVLYFTATNAANGQELWQLDPTTGSPIFLKDIYPGSSGSSPGNLTYSNGKLYFTADNGIQGIELWAVNVDVINNVGNVSKTSDEDQTVTFTATDFSSVFSSSSGSPLATVKILLLPSNGVLKLGNNPVAANQEIPVANLNNLTFIPNANYNGTAGFTWNGSDGTTYAANPSTVTLTINSINDAPTVASPIADVNVYSNRASNFTFSANTFQDVDLGDSLTYTATLADGSSLPNWLTLSDRTFSGNPAIANAGQYEIKVTAKDQSNATVTDNFILNVVNSAPFSININNNTIPENSANDTLIGTLNSQDNNSNDTFTYTLVNDAGGRFILDGNNIVVANSSLLDYEAATQHTIRVRTTDSSGLSYEQNITILLSNVNDALAGTLSFTSPTYSINENGTPVAAVTVQRTNGNEGVVSANILLSDGTATYPDDYSTTALTVVFGSGETSKTVTIPLFNDTIYEGNETLNLTLSGPTGGASLGTQTTATLTIVDNDLPTVSLGGSPNSVTEDGTNNFVYTFTRTGNTVNPLTVNFNVGGTATFNNDYIQTGAVSFNGTSGTITFAAGSDTAILTLDPTVDNIFEADETVNLTLVSSANYNRGTTTAVISTITNDDQPAGIFSFSSPQFSVNEDGTPITTVTINRAGNSNGEVSVTLNLNNGTATAPTDYNNSPIVVTFADGETSKTIDYAQISQGLSFDGINDRVESNQLFPNVTDTFTIEFWTKPTATRNVTTESNNGSSGTGGQRYAIYPVQGEAASLGSNHAGVGVSVGTNGISVFEHSASYLPSPLVYQNTVSDWTHIAIVYNDKTPSLYVNGQFIKTGIKSNYIVHPSLQLGVNTGGGSNYGVYQGQLDDVRIWNKSRTQAEIQADFTEQLTGNETGLVGYWNFNSITGNTVQDLISNQNNGTIFEAQSTNGFVPPVVSPTILIVDDQQFEPNETINLSLSNPQGGAILGTQTTATLTIIDNDAPKPGTISFNNASYTVNENGTATINLIRTVGSDGEVTVTLTPSDNTATAGSDYNNSPVTVTFANGETSKLVTIPIIDNNVYEPTETVNLTLSNPTGGATLGTQNTAILNIIDNDAVPGTIQFSNTTYSINENGIPVTAVTLTRTNGSDGAVSVRINLTNGTATAPNDYNNTPITVNFADEETSKTVTIPIVDDTQFEADETLNLTLTNPQGSATLGTQTTATLTIINDDLPQPGILAFNGANYTVNENGTATITINRTVGTNGEVSVTITPINGTATAPDDYTNTPITVTFAEGESSKTVTIPINNDAVYEPTETVNLNLSNPTGGATLGTQQNAVLSIIDNDAVPGTIQFSNTAYSINENGTPVTAVNLTRTGGSDGAVSVRINLTNGTATAPNDYNNTPITVN